jgi:glycosyltransferase involved in cell wall biosynthesis
MRITFASLFEAYPPLSGSPAVTYGCASHLDAEVSLVQFGPEPGTRRLPNGITVTSVLEATQSRWRKLVRMPASLLRLAAEVAGSRPDYIVIAGGSWSVYLAALVWMLRRRLPKTPIAYHAHNVEYLLRRERNGRAVAAITRRAEGYLLTRARHSFAVSPVDQGHFLRLYGTLPDLLPNAVDCDDFAAVTPEAASQTRDRYGLAGDVILFMGLYAYPPNKEAVDFLVFSVMPEVLSKHPQAKLLVTGGVVPYQRPWLINPGFLPHADLRAAIKSCRAGVAPVFGGSGTRLKILEYMAGGLPVVTTRKGAEGLPLAEERHVLFAERPSEFAAAILRLLDSAELGKHLASGAAALVREQFDWSKALTEFRLRLGIPERVQA